MRLILFRLKYEEMIEYLMRFLEVIRGALITALIKLLSINNHIITTLGFSQILENEIFIKMKDNDRKDIRE